MRAGGEELLTTAECDCHTLAFSMVFSPLYLSLPHMSQHMCPGHLMRTGRYFMPQKMIRLTTHFLLVGGIKSRWTF